MKLRPDIKAQARKNFSAQYGVSLGAFIVYAVLAGAASSTFIGGLLLVPPLMVGYASFCLGVYRGAQGDIGEMFSTGFRDYGRNLGGILWMELFIFLWSLLFIIPGIIKALAYFATPYILADTRNVPATDALKLSMRMTAGHKGKVFVMILSFIGWGLLTALGYWWLYLALWLLPLATWYQLVSRIRNIAEHAVVPDNDDSLRNTRTTYAGPLTRLLLAPFWVNYHLEHHLLLFVPCWRLRQAHRMMLAKGWGERMELRRSYAEVLRLAASAVSDSGGSGGAKVVHI